MEITIGLELDIMLNSYESGNFIRTGSLRLDYNQDNEDNIESEKTGKIELLLFKNIEAYQNGAKPLYWRYSIPLKYTLIELFNPIKPLPELLYDKIIIYSYCQQNNEEETILIEPFKNAKRLTIII